MVVTSKRIRAIIIASYLLSASSISAQTKAPVVTVPSATVDKVIIKLPGKQPDTLVPFTERDAEWDSEYATIVSNAMPEAFAPSVILREIVLHAFIGEESVLAMEPKGKNWRIFALKSKDWLWRYTAYGRSQAWEFDRVRLRPEGYRKVGIARCSVETDHMLGNRIKTIWDEMLSSAVRHSYSGPRAADTPRVLLFGKVGRKVLAAKPPYQDTERVSAFLRINRAMTEACETPGQLKQANLASHVRNFEQLPRRGSRR